MLTEQEKQQQQANRYIQQLQQIDPLAILAGGAPRDWWFNKPATDLDIFIHPGECGKKPKYWKERLESKGFKVKEVKTKYCTKQDTSSFAFVNKFVGFVEQIFKPSNYHAELSMNPYLECVIDLEVEPGEIPVQVMIMNQSVHDCTYTKFPVSVSQIWYRDNKLNPTKDFMVTNKHGVMYVTGQDNSAGGKYTKKIREKFPEFEFLDSKEKVMYYLSDKLTKHGYR